MPIAWRCVVDPVFRAITDLVWPAQCPVCGQWYESPTSAWTECDGRPVLHRDCMLALEPAPRLEVVPAVLGFPVVALLQDSPAWFTILHRAKYGGEIGLLEPWAALCAEAIVAGGGLPHGTVLLPVPDDPGRRRSRGASPVTTLARGIASRLGVAVREDLIRRRRTAPSQTTLGDDGARARNVADLYGVGRLAEIPRERPLVLVDDQATSGSTLGAAARIAGARGNPLALLVLARAKRTPTVLQP